MEQQIPSLIFQQQQLRQESLRHEDQKDAIESVTAVSGVGVSPLHTRMRFSDNASSSSRCHSLPSLQPGGSSASGLVHSDGSPSVRAFMPAGSAGVTSRLGVQPTVAPLREEAAAREGPAGCDPAIKSVPVHEPVEMDLLSRFAQ